MNYKYSQFRHGMKCTCEIDGTKITDAKISINRDGKVYICQAVMTIHTDKLTHGLKFFNDLHRKYVTPRKFKTYELVELYETLSKAV